MRHLLVSCDTSWAPEGTDILESFSHHFDRVTIHRQGKFDLDISCSVTHWMVNPAPSSRITVNFIQQVFPKLQVLASPSTGTTHIDRDLSASLGIRVYCLRDLPREKLNSITSSSEHTFFLFLCLVRKSRDVLNADLSSWRDNLTLYRGRQIAGMSVMVFGFGRIGRNICRYLSTFGASVVIYDPDETLEVDIGRRISLGEIPVQLKSVDAVFLCYHWSPENDKFFSREFLETMREDSFIVNTSRGENIDETALLELIEAGKFSGVGLDVLTGEQEVGFPADRITQLAKKKKNFIITPHVAGASYDSEKMAFTLMMQLMTQHYVE
jgi:D-3-phosphoglycerate dehydrogenase / 2-oxoglutarate reductase